MNDHQTIQEKQIAGALRSAGETRERPPVGMHERIMRGIEQEPKRLGLIDLLRPAMALAAVAALAVGVTMAMLAQEDRERAAEAREFMRVTFDLTESARTIEREILNRANRVFVDPMERQAEELRGDARALIQKVREAMPERSTIDG